MSSNRLTDVYDKNVPEKNPDKIEISNGVEDRALQMHMTNLKMWLAQYRDIKTSVGGMGETIITINELYEGKPKGVSSSVTFAKDGSLISLATY